MAKRVTLKDYNGNVCYPATHASLVQTPSGGNVGDELLNKINLSQLDFSLDMIGKIITASTPCKFVVMQNSKNVGILHCFSDNGNHMLTQVFTTHYLLPFSNNSHTDDKIYQYFRSYHLSGGTSQIPTGTWGEWKLVFSSDINTETVKLGEEDSSSVPVAPEVTADYANKALKDWDGNDLRKAMYMSGVLEYEEFSTSKAYSVGDVVSYLNKAYKFIAPHSAGAWDESQVEETSLKGEIENEIYKKEEKEISRPLYMTYFKVNPKVGTNFYAILKSLTDKSGEVGGNIRLQDTADESPNYTLVLKSRPVIGETYSVVVNDERCKYLRFYCEGGDGVIANLEYKYILDYEKLINENSQNITNVSEATKSNTEEIKNNANEISGLKVEVFGNENPSEYERFDYDSQGWYQGNDDLSKTTYVSNDNNYVCTKIQVKVGESYTIRTEGTINAKAWILTDENLNILSRAEQNLNCIDSPVTLDIENDGFLCVNCKKLSYDKSKCYTNRNEKGVSLRNLITKNTEEISDLKNQIENTDMTDAIAKSLGIQFDAIYMQKTMEDKSWANLDKPVFTFRIDDMNPDTSKYIQMFKKLNLPLCFAVIKENLNKTTSIFTEEEINGVGSEESGWTTYPLGNNASIEGVSIKEALLYALSNMKSEILIHGINYISDDNMNDFNYLYETYKSNKDFIENELSVKAYGFAMIGGSSNITKEQMAIEAKWLSALYLYSNRNNRWTDDIAYQAYGGTKSRPMPNNIGGTEVNGGTYTTNIDTAFSEKQWLEIVVHGVGSDTYTNLYNVIKYIQSKGQEYEVLTYKEAYSKYFGK